MSMSSSGVDSKPAASVTAANGDRPTSADVNNCSTTAQLSATSSTTEQTDVALRYALHCTGRMARHIDCV